MNQVIDLPGALFRPKAAQEMLVASQQEAALSSRK
jgi:hypothetical protein